MPAARLMRWCGGAGVVTRRCFASKAVEILKAEKSKLSALDKAIAQIQSSYGKGSLMRLDSSDVAEGVEVCHSSTYWACLKLRVHRKRSFPRALLDLI